MENVLKMKSASRLPEPGVSTRLPGRKMPEAPETIFTLVVTAWWLLYALSFAGIILWLIYES